MVILPVVQMGHVFQLGFGAGDVLHGLLYVRKEDFPFVGQGNSLVAANEKLTGQLLLQPVDDPGDVGLAVVQYARRHGKAFAGSYMIENPI